MSESSIKINIGDEIINGTQITTNVKQQFIVVPKDRAKLILKEYDEQQRGKIDWISPIALTITILAALLTADFKENIAGLEKGFWQAFFVLALIASIIWSVHNCWIAATQKTKSIDTVVEELSDNEIHDKQSYVIDSLPRLSKWIVMKLLKSE